MKENIKAGLIGHPIGHSLSPLIHNHWMERYGLSGLYQSVDIAPENLGSAVAQMAEDGYAGFNITLPYKREIITLCDSVDETAQQIGAVNTVVVNEDGALHGLNTDSFGFAENLLQASEDTDLKGATALVLGAGGAARGVIHGLLSIGAGDIKIANRTREKAEEIARVFPVQVVPWEERESAARDVSLLVNTTSLGMEGQGPLEFDMRHLPKSAAVCDIVYRPLETELLREAKERGNSVVTGIGMLLHQARPAFWEWFGVMPEVDDDLQQKILEALS